MDWLTEDPIALAPGPSFLVFYVLVVAAAVIGFFFWAGMADEPWRLAVQAHFAGGRVSKDGRWIDSHDRPAPPEAYEALHELSRRGTLKAAILERDENLPPFEDLLAELDRAREAMA